MENRHKKLVLEADEGVTFEVLKGESGQLIIRAKITDATTVNYKNYANPPIPEGYKHVCGEWNNGFVIERTSDGSQFVWIPVGFLDNDGTIDGVSYTEKFGRRLWNKGFPSSKFYEELEGDLSLQIKSVNKYGGFYISRYNISKNSNGKPQSVKGVMPWTEINFFDAMNVAFDFENTEEVMSHLPYGAEYDSVLAWLIKSNAKTLYEIVTDSTKWGNNWGANNDSKPAVTGSNERWCANKIYDLAGNVGEWTQEQYDFEYRLIRGGCSVNKFFYPVASFIATYPTRFSLSTSFRIVLYIK